MAQPLLEVSKLSKRFCRDPHRGAAYAVRDIVSDITMQEKQDSLRNGEFWALRDVSFNVSPGEVVGIIGHNGAGKTTLINLVSGILRPSVGKVRLNTENIVMMSHQGQLDSVQSGRENIVNQLLLYGSQQNDLAENVEKVIEFSELGKSIDAPVGTYSLGMKLRLSFAIYTRLNPDLFVVDEALNGGDLQFQRKFQTFLEEYIAGGGAILLASHDLYTIQLLCNRCILMEKGEIVAMGDPVDVINTYQLLEKTNRSCEPLTDRASLLQSIGAISTDNGQKETVRIEAVQVTAFGGGPLLPGAAAMLEIVCSCDEDLEMVACGVSIGRHDVFPVAMLGRDQLTLKKGKNKLRCKIVSLPLVPGIYNMTVGFIRSNGYVLGLRGYMDNSLSFEIISKPDALVNQERFRKCVVHLSADWQALEHYRQ